MRVLLISANTETINMRTLPWGLLCVGAAAREAGNEVRLLDLMMHDDTRAAAAGAIDDFAPDVIGISVRNIDDQASEKPVFFLEKVKEVVGDCRRALSSATLVLGGAGFSILPEAALEYLQADVGIQGEGEIAFPELLKRIERGDPLLGTPNLYIRGAGRQGERLFAEDLDRLPLPEDLLVAPYRKFAQDLWIPLQTRRGCAMNCSYCSTSIIEGRRLRCRSPEPVIEWIARRTREGFARFYFVDNNFNIPASFAQELCRKMMERKIDIEWRCILNPVGVDRGLVGNMARAGCREVSLGFESGSEQILERMNKKFTPDEVRLLAAELKRHGIRRNGFLLLGGPGETRASCEESLAFADSLDLEMVRVTRGIRIYPLTPLAATACEEGVISPNDNLLFPRFYLAKGLEGWLSETANQWKEKRPNWIF
jgi:radical SAM superfamily enzyme YgiQ (UPF0313 family)